jgi:hemin uptake protein HemP
LPLAIGGAALTFRVDGEFFRGGYYSDACVLKTFIAPVLTVLPAVEFFNTSRDGNNVRLEWDDVEGATAYAIYKAEVSVSTHGTTPTETNAVDIYFVLDGNGLFSGITNNSGTHSGQIYALKITRTAGNTPQTSWEIIYSDEVMGTSSLSAFTGGSN